MLCKYSHIIKYCNILLNPCMILHCRDVSHVIILLLEMKANFFNVHDYVSALPEKFLIYRIFSSFSFSTFIAFISCSSLLEKAERPGEKLKEETGP